MNFFEATRVKVFRFEKDGSGVYHAQWNSGGEAIREVIRKYDLDSSTPRTPSPYEDAGFTPHRSKLGSAFIFGFNSAEMLFKWFPHHITEELMKAGAELKVYRVEEDAVFASQKQCIFNRHLAVCIRTVTSYEEALAVLS